MTTPHDPSAEAMADAAKARLREFFRPAPHGDVVFLAGGIAAVDLEVLQEDNSYFYDTPLPELATPNAWKATFKPDTIWLNSLRVALEQEQAEADAEAKDAYEEENTSHGEWVEPEYEWTDWQLDAGRAFCFYVAKGSAPWQPDVQVPPGWVYCLAVQSVRVE